ncbi:serine/threonine protein kinase [Minicystis rosea]|nr:serine/threonine protein kinase [Minicystis rosea]
MPGTIVPNDEGPLDALIGREVPSEVMPGVSYRITWELGQGGMSVVFYALRVTADGEIPVVIKMLKPTFVVKAGPTASLIVKKEAIALGRLNEHVPPTPFVVRFIDTGTHPVEYCGATVHVPWVVVEYVHGGAEGTTLSERVDHSLQSTGAGFDPARAAHAIDCLTSGLSAVHEVGVIHRDLKPDNVLCCGFGEDEIFKLADFGVARPAGIATFTGTVVGTPGFVAPELSSGDPRAIGSWTDIFSLAAVIFFMLTGEEYFSAKTPADALVMAIAKERRSIRDTRGLSPELRAHEQACRSIDFALSSATAGKIENRPHRADALAAMIVPWLRVESTRSSLLFRRLKALHDDREPELSRFRFHTMRGPSQEGAVDGASRSALAPGFVVRSVAWDGDGRAMAATHRGLAFWNGSTWGEPNAVGLPDPLGVRFVQRVAAGQWLVGGDEATFATLAPEGVTGVQRLANSPLRAYDKISGDLDDLAVLVGSSPGGPPTLCALAGRRWLKPLPLTDVAALSSLARIEDAKWLLAGRGTDGRAFVALYSPLDWEVQRLETPSTRAYLACAGQVDREIGVATGMDGAVVVRERQAITHELIEGFDLSAAAVDAAGRAWAASAGRIWMRNQRAGGSRWDVIWEDASFRMPIVSLFADLAGVTAMTADGGVIEGRIMRVTRSGDD